MFTRQVIKVLKKAKKNAYIPLLVPFCKCFGIKIKKNISKTKKTLLKRSKNWGFFCLKNSSAENKKTHFISKNHSKYTAINIVEYQCVSTKT